jgi:4-hydroxy-3-polyprenylbenzoate decarboxylase
MAAIHLKVHEANGPALLFENVKNTAYRAASNIFGTIERSKFIFRNRLKLIQQLIQLRNNPQKIFKNHLKQWMPALLLYHPYRRKQLQKAF